MNHKEKKYILNGEQMEYVWFALQFMMDEMDEEEMGNQLGTTREFLSKLVAEIDSLDERTDEEIGLEHIDN